MNLNRLHNLAARAGTAAGGSDEHAAVVDLLVLTAYSDDRISTEELDALDAFDASHAGWDEGGFSVEQYLPAAIAKVRQALERPGGVDQLLSGAAGRITSAPLRHEALAACRELAASDGLDTEEVGWLQRVDAALT